MWDIVIWILFGTMAGVFAGLLPGIHPNTFIAGLLAIMPWMLTFASPTALAVFVVSCVISNSFVSFIPSIFIGAPEAETALGVLPGHQMMLEGKGYEAVWLTVMGGLGVILLSIIFAPFLFISLPLLYDIAKNYMFWLLAGVITLMILKESGLKKVWGLLVFFLSGILGIFVLNNPIMAPQWILFPVFTGLFGMSTMLVSIKSNQNIPEQKIDCIKISKMLTAIGVVKGWIAGMIVGILPGIGPAQATAVVQESTRRKNNREFLIAIGGITTVSPLFSMLALYLIEKSRSGAAIAIQHILGEFGIWEVGILITTSLFVAGISSLITLKFANFFARIIQNINYKNLGILVIFGIVFLVGALTGIVGLCILGISTAIGLIAPLSGVRRTHAMGVLMIPVMLWYLPL